MKKIGLILLSAGMLFISSCKKDEGVTDGDHKEKFLKSYGTLAYGVDFKQTSDGGFILLGTTAGAVGSDFLLVRTDAYGNTQWSKSYSGPGNGSDNQAAAIEILSNGNYAILGTTTSPAFSSDSTNTFELSSTYLFLVDYLGNKITGKAFSSGIVEPIVENERALGMAYDDNGTNECLFFTSSKQTSNGTIQSVVRKYDLSTGQDFELLTSGNINKVINDLVVYSDELIVGVGYSTLTFDSISNKNSYSWKLIKDSSGEVSYKGDFTFGSDGEDEALSLIKSNSGDILAIGFNTGTDGDKQLLISSLQGLESGSPSKGWSFEGSTLGLGSEEGCSIIEVDDGLIVAGYTEDVDRQFLVAKINATGTSVLWEKNYGYVSFDEAKSIVQTDDDGLAVFGTSSDERGNPVMTMLKLDASGNLQ